MAQRTAFLNSDAKGYNKDFHHTWIHNYLLHQVGVMFTDYTTKNEFKLGNGQISGGKAIIRCTRTTGNFAGSKILALFESTTTESISTSGDKKVFIEIPEIYVNDSTAITDTLTQGLNLGVGVIKSEADYPSHTNYIPLWEITGGDWEHAVDVRPEILARGKPNTISYTDNNGVQRNMMLDASSLNKFLKSNGAGVAPSWADVGDVVEVSNLKNTFFAGEDLLPKSMFRMESELDTVDAVDESIRFGYDSNSAKVQLNTILSGEGGDYVKLNLEGFNTPADNVNVRIETVDSSGNATGTLIHPDATATINPTGTLEEMNIDLAGMVDGTTAGQEVAVVLSRSGALSTSNYYKVGVATADTGIWKVKTFDGTSWNLETGKKGYISSPLFMEEGAIQSKATTGFLAETTGYVEAGATAGNEFTGVRFGMVEHNGFKPGDKVFLTDTGELDSVGGSVRKQIGSGIKGGSIEIGLTGLGGGFSGYDAVVAQDGSGDYTLVGDALEDGNSRIFIKEGIYEEGLWDISDRESVLIEGEGHDRVTLKFSDEGRGNYTNLITVRHIKGLKMTGITFDVILDNNGSNFLTVGANGAVGFLVVKQCVFRYNRTTNEEGRDLFHIYDEYYINKASKYLFESCFFTTSSSSSNPIYCNGYHITFLNCKFAVEDNSAPNGYFKIRGKNFYSCEVSGMKDLVMSGELFIGGKVAITSTTGTYTKSFNIYTVESSDIKLKGGTVEMGLGCGANSKIFCYGTLTLAGDSDKHAGFSNCYLYGDSIFVEAKDSPYGYFLNGCNIDGNTTTSKGSVYFNGCNIMHGTINVITPTFISGSKVSNVIANFSTKITGSTCNSLTLSTNRCVVSGNQINGDSTITGDNCIITGNTSSEHITLGGGTQSVVVGNVFKKFTDSGTSTTKANNIETNP